jgi:N-acyl-D-aspartate/D-glutamate deacylase
MQLSVLGFGCGAVGGLMVRGDPDGFRDEATYANPHQYPSGASTTVIVNGIVVIENATHTGATPGIVLCRRADASVG